MKKIEKVIYLAGIIDGEGCVKPHSSSSNFLRGYKKQIQARCEVSNTSKELADWLQKNFGGDVRTVKREGNRKTQYWWRLRNGEMKKVLPQIIPYLIVKKEEALQTLTLIKRV